MLILPDFLIDNPGQPPRQQWGVRNRGIRAMIFLETTENM